MTNPMTYAEMLSELEYGVDLVRDNEPALFTADQIHGIKLIEKIIDSLRVRVEQDASILARIETCLEITLGINNNVLPMHLVKIRDQLKSRLEDKDHA